MDEQMIARMKEMLQQKEDQITFLKRQIEHCNQREKESLLIIRTLASRLPEVPQQTSEQE